MNLSDNSPKKRTFHQTTIQFNQNDSSISNSSSKEFVDNEFPPNISSIDGIQSTLSTETKKIYCSCRILTRIRQVSKDGPNQGKYFHSCVTKKCNFFLWANENDISHKKFETSLEWKRFQSNEGWSLVSPTYGYQSNHILQGKVGDCWFMGALSVIAERSDLMEKIMVTTELSNKMSFQFYFNGHWKIITIDNFLPCTLVNSQPNLVYSKAKHSQLWVSFLEKAYAKGYGSYHAISGGFIHEAMFDLTSYPSKIINFNEPNFNSEELWIQLISYHSLKFPMGCSSSCANQNDGIVNRHAYSILQVIELDNVVLGEQLLLDDFFTINSNSNLNVNSNSNNELLTETGSLRVLQIRNPWGSKEWSGELSHNSLIWTNKLMKLLNKTNKNDGTFWITYHNFMKNYDIIDVCIAFEKSLNWINKIYNNYYINNNNNNILLNCKYYYNLIIIDYNWLYLTIIQKSKRGNDQSYWYVSMGVVILNEQNEIIKTMYCCAQRNIGPIELHLNPGIYQIIITNISPNNISKMNNNSNNSNEEEFYLQVYSSNECIVDSIINTNEIQCNIIHKTIKQLLLTTNYSNNSNNIIDLKLLFSTNIQLSPIKMNEIVDLSMEIEFNEIQLHYYKSNNNVIFIIINNQSNYNIDCLIHIVSSNFKIQSNYLLSNNKANTKQSTNSANNNSTIDLTTNQTINPLNSQLYHSFQLSVNKLSYIIVGILIDNYNSEPTIHGNVTENLSHVSCYYRQQQPNQTDKQYSNQFESSLFLSQSFL